MGGTAIHVSPDCKAYRKHIEELRISYILNVIEAQIKRRLPKPKEELKKHIIVEINMCGWIGKLTRSPKKTMKN